jgi:hypothetical protein
MKKITLVAGLALILVLPAVSVAKPTPDRADKRAAKTECNMFRGHSSATREAFQTKYDTFKVCVRSRARDEAQEEQSAHTNAAKECKAKVPALHGREYGKCVSSTAKAKEHEADQEDQENASDFKNAAKECDAERDLDEAAFADQYGTNANKKNAFGKCVSKKARENHEENESETETPPAS